MFNRFLRIFIFLIVGHVPHHLAWWRGMSPLSDLNWVSFMEVQLYNRVKKNGIRKNKMEKTVAKLPVPGFHRVLFGASSIIHRCSACVLPVQLRFFTSTPSWWWRHSNSTLYKVISKYHFWPLSVIQSSIFKNCQIGPSPLPFTLY